MPMPSVTSGPKKPARRKSQLSFYPCSMAFLLLLMFTLISININGLHDGDKQLGLVLLFGEEAFS